MPTTLTPRSLPSNLKILTHPPSTWATALVELLQTLSEVSFPETSLLYTVGGILKKT